MVTGNRFITARPAAATQAAPPQRDEAVAVIGLSGVFPKAPNAEAFWRNLADGMDCIDDVPKARWHWDNFFSQSQWRAQDQAETKWGGFLDAPENFDPAFFGISSSEAELMDPQQRLLMTETWKALEDAGYSTSNEHGNKTGVFIGTIGTDYDKLAEINGVPPGIHSVTGNNPALLSARIASFLDLKGPNMAVATTCSSSLVAIHLACQSIRNGESDMAVAGGAFIMSTPERYLFMNKGGLVSPSGKCRTFDDGADGFIPGESVGVVVLKPLSAAIKDRDHIYGVITGSGVSHDGKTSAISAPSRAAQKELALAVYQQAGLNPADVTYVEAHGTASKLGDHIEFDAMAEAFREYTDKTQYCAIGSVRTNIGHSVASACISSVIKVLMGLKYKQIPPSLNFETANEYIKFDKSPFYVPTALRDWQAAQDGKRRACINAFALSGTNAHAVIEEFIDADREAEKLNEPLLFVLSAKNQARLQAYAGDMSEFLQRHAELALADIAYTLQTRRMPMDVRLAFSAASMTELCAKLSAYHDNPQAGGGLYSGNVRQGKKLYSQLFAGATGDDFIKLAMQRREWSRLAQLWVNGAKIDWRPLYENSAARHVSLPTYPFAEKAFWVAASAVAASASFPRMRESMPPDSLRRENDGSGGEKQVEVLYDLRLPSAANPVKPKPTDANTVLYDLRLPENNTAPSSPQESSGMDARLRGDDDGVGNDGEIQNTATTPPLAAEAKPPLQVKVEQELTHILANLLQVNGNEINTAQEIAEYNLDSIVLTAYVGKINDTYDLNFMPMALADYPTISAFADYLCREYTEALEDYYA